MYGQKNVTYIKDLPELEDLESQQQFQHHGPPSGLPEKYQKFIRPNMGPSPVESGMNSSSYHQEFSDNSRGDPRGDNSRGDEPYNSMSEVREGYENRSSHCIDIFQHIESCPICSKFFKKDYSVYIIAIVLLSIICILLLKRVLNL